MMNIIEIAYIDDDRSHLKYFPHSFDAQANSNLRIVPFYPPDSLEELVDALLKQNISALIVDYRLREKNIKIRYNGTDLIKSFREIRPDFPAFILTAYEDDAEEVCDDVNLVYDKSRIFDDSNYSMTFIKKIERQIEKYTDKERLNNKELERLLKEKIEGKLKKDELIIYNNLLDRFNYIQGLKEEVNASIYDQITNIVEQFNQRAITSQKVNSVQKLTSDFLDAFQLIEKIVEEIDLSLLKEEILYELNEFNTKSRDLGNESDLKSRLLNVLQGKLNKAKKYIYASLYGIIENPNQIDLVVDTEFELFSTREFDEIINKISFLLDIDKEKLKVSKILPGSTKITIASDDPEIIDKLGNLIFSGALKELGIEKGLLTEVNIHRMPQAYSDSSDTANVKDMLIDMLGEAEMEKLFNAMDDAFKDFDSKKKVEIKLLRGDYKALVRSYGNSMLGVAEFHQAVNIIRKKASDIIAEL